MSENGLDIEILGCREDGELRGRSANTRKAGTHWGTQPYRSEE